MIHVEGVVEDDESEEAPVAAAFERLRRPPFFWFGHKLKKIDVRKVGGGNKKLACGR